MKIKKNHHLRGVYIPSKTTQVSPQVISAAEYRAQHIPANPTLALGRLKIGEMNKTEAAYDQYLWSLRYAGEILWHKFEGIKLRLADNTFYTVDFPVLAASGYLEMHEIKGGFWQDDARVKIKVAASLYPFKFIAVKAKAKKLGGGWEREEF